jgi:hypothetical protein
VKDIQSGVDGTGLQLASIGARFCALLSTTSSPAP